MNTFPLVDHPALLKIHKCKCGFKGCLENAIGVFEVADDTETVDVSLCDKHAKEFTA